jgi:hypothetical protein
MKNEQFNIPCLTLKLQKLESNDPEKSIVKLKPQANVNIVCFLCLKHKQNLFQSDIIVF